MARVQDPDSQINCIKGRIKILLDEFASKGIDVVFLRQHNV